MNGIHDLKNINLVPNCHRSVLPCSGLQYSTVHNFYTVYYFPAITLLTVFWCDNCTVYSVQLCSYLWCLIAMVGEGLYNGYREQLTSEIFIQCGCSGWLMKPSEPSILHKKPLYSSPEGLIHLSALLKLFHFNGPHYKLINCPQEM